MPDDPLDDPLRYPSRYTDPRSSFYDPKKAAAKAAAEAARAARWERETRNTGIVIMLLFVSLLGVVGFGYFKGFVTFEFSTPNFDWLSSGGGAPSTPVDTRGADAGPPWSGSFRWNRCVLTYRHDPIGGSPTAIASVNTAIADISAMTGFRFTELATSSKSRPDVLFNWGMLPPDRVGQASQNVNWSGVFNHVTVTVEPNLGPQQELRTLRHELGHAIGIDHSGDEADLMFGGRDRVFPAATGFSPADIAAFKAAAARAGCRSS